MKSAFKSFDYFRKTNPDHIRSTRVGGLVSLCSLSAMVALTMITYSKYLQPKIERKSYIMSNREETEELVPVNIDAVFPNMPCALVNVAQQVGFRHVPNEEVYSTITRTRLNEVGDPI
jgi:hypothetical protein